MADEQAKRERTPWVQLAAIGLVALYTILFIVLNTHRATVSFVFASEKSPFVTAVRVVVPRV